MAYRDLGSEQEVINFEDADTRFYVGFRPPKSEKTVNLSASIARVAIKVLKGAKEIEVGEYVFSNIDESDSVGTKFANKVYKEQPQNLMSLKDWKPVELSGDFYDPNSIKIKLEV